MPDIDPLLTELSIHRLVRTRRRSLALIVTPDAHVVVRAPLRMSLKSIHAFVAQKRDWILDKKTFFLKNRPSACRKEFTAGEKFLFLGKTYPLEIVYDRFLVSLGSTLQIPHARLADARQALTVWYKEQAEKIIRLSADRSAAGLGVQYTRLRVGSAGRRWGSCGPRNTLNFCWRLVMAPREVIDYVVVHELAHILHKNHSHAFWDQVRDIVPDFKERKKWLKDHAPEMMW